MCRKRIFKTKNLIKKDRDKIHSKNAQAFITWLLRGKLGILPTSFIGTFSVQFYVLCRVYNPLNDLAQLFSLFRENTKYRIKTITRSTDAFGIFFNLCMDFFFQFVILLHIDRWWNFYVKINRRNYILSIERFYVRFKSRIQT